MPHPDADDPSDVELSEEVEGGSSESTPVPTDSSVDLNYAGEAPDVDPYEFNPEAAPNRDLSGFQDDAGADASYGFESASETARYTAEEVEEELAEDANLNDSGEFTAVPGGPADDDDELTDALPSDSGENIPVGGGAVDEAPAEDLYASQADAGYAGDEYAAEDGGATAQDEYSGPDGGYVGEEAYADGADYGDGAGAGFTMEEEPAAGGFTVEEEPAAEEAAPPEHRPTARMAPPSAPLDAGDDDEDRPNRPGQIAKNALDDIFARAAKLKKKGSN